MTHKHTQGPWRVDGWENCTIYAPDDSEGDPKFITCMKVTAKVIQEPQGLHSYPKLTEQKANAHLIASAPELLEALLRLWSITNPFETPDDLVDTIEAAIAKANGTHERAPILNKENEGKEH